MTKFISRLYNYKFDLDLMAEKNHISNIMNNDEAEKSFFALCELDLLKIDQYDIYNNIEKWHMIINGYRIKNNLIQIDICVPYSEMSLEVDERSNDLDFFGKSTARITISSNNDSNIGLYSYINSKIITIEFSTEIKYVLFNTPYFYPHNWYYAINKDYLYKKISYSINFMQYFIQAYKDTFQTGIPLIYIKQTREYRHHYEIDIILKEYLTISFVKTDLSTATLFFHLLLENEKKTNCNINHIAKYHNITVKIPRDIRTGNVFFKFTANMI